MFPDPARFHDALATDPRAHLVYGEVAMGWNKFGPSIRVYKVDNACSVTS
jgi:hypothetical protein